MKNISAFNKTNYKGLYNLKCDFNIFIEKLEYVSNLDYLENFYIFIYKESDDIIGFLLYTHIKENIYVECSYGYVSEKHRNKKIMKNLISYSIKILDELGCNIKQVKYNTNYNTAKSLYNHVENEFKKVKNGKPYHTFN